MEEEVRVQGQGYVVKRLGFHNHVTLSQICLTRIWTLHIRWPRIASFEVNCVMISKDLDEVLLCCGEDSISRKRH